MLRPPRTRVTAVASTLALAVVAASLGGCGVDPKSPWAFRQKLTPVAVTVTGPVADGARVGFGDVALEAVEVRAERTDDELVGAAVRGSLADLARAAALVSVGAKATAVGAAVVADETERTDPHTARAAGQVAGVSGTVSDVAGHVARAAALATVLGALTASVEQRTEASFRASVGPRPYRATCAATDRATLFDPEGRPSLSCAIVAVVEHPTRHWALDVRTPGGAADRKRLVGSLEARTAAGRVETAPIVRVASTDSAHTVKNDQGVEVSEMLGNAFVELDTVQTRLASVELPPPAGGQGRAWVDTTSLADPEAGDAVRVAAAIVSAFGWPGLR